MACNSLCDMMRIGWCFVDTFNRVDPSLRQKIRPTLNQSRPHSPRQMTSKMSPILSHQSRVSSTLEANNHAPLLDPQLASPVSVHPTPFYHLSPSSSTMQIFTSFPSSPTSLVPILSMAARPTPHKQKHKKFCRQSTSQPPSRPNPTQRDISNQRAGNSHLSHGRGLLDGHGGELIVAIEPEARGDCRL